MQKFVRILLFAVGGCVLILAGGCEPQDREEINTAGPSSKVEPPAQAPETELELAKGELARTKADLEKVRGENFDLQRKVEKLEKQLSSFDEKGLGAKLTETSQKNEQLKAEIEKLEKQLAETREKAAEK